MASILSLGRRAAEIVLAVLFLGSYALLEGNDAVVEFAAGGIQLRQEARISMEKERLKIGLGNVTVEYEFLNMADQDITTEVAFPIPPYEYNPSALQTGYPYFTDFRVWVDGQEVKYETEIRAKFKDTDYTDLLLGLGIDIETFGDSNPQAEVDNSQIAKLPKSAKENLMRLGLLDEIVSTDGTVETRENSPQWTVQKTYHWRQQFPAHKILKVRHEYSPSSGYYQLIVGAAPFQLEDLVKEACLDPALEKRLGAAGERMKAREGSIHAMGTQEVVKYILTTANTWRTPIKDFELIVERPQTPGQAKKFISFCWDGKVQRLDENHFVARETNFVPARELAVYYFQGEF
jgi:hypothetical protein